jgi:hypothetical protein
LTTAEPVSESRLFLGRPYGMKRFVSMYRRDPFWMTPKVGVSPEEVQPDTQWFLAERDDGEFTVLVPLLDGPFRSCIVPSQNGLAVEVASGDPAVVDSGFDTVYIASGENVYALLEAAAEDVAKFIHARLRKDKRVPAFANWFGWCTWDAFYEDVSHDNVRLGLEGFRDVGITPKFLVLDAGWQTVAEFSTRERRLTGFAANDQFSGDLSATVSWRNTSLGSSSSWCGMRLEGFGEARIPRVFLSTPARCRIEDSLALFWKTFVIRSPGGSPGSSREDCRMSLALWA